MELYEWKGLFLLFLVLLMLVPHPVLHSYSAQTASRIPKVDASSLAQILIKIMHDVESLNVSELGLDVSHVINASLPQSLKYVHKRAYLDLLNAGEEANKCIKASEEAERNPTPENVRRLRALAIDVYSAKIRVSQSLNSYVSAITRMIVPTYRTYYAQVLNEEVEKLMSFLNGVVARAGYVIRKVEGLHALAELKPVKVPNETIAGLTLNIKLRVYWRKKLEGSPILKAFITSGFEYISNASATVPANGSLVSLNLSIPPAYMLPASKASSIPAELDITLECKLNSSLIAVSRTLSRIYIKVLKPKLELRVPPLILYGHDAVIRATSQVRIPLNISVVLDGAEMFNKTLMPGSSEIVIPASNLSKGYHTLMIRVWPSGPYLGTQYSSDLEVSGLPVKAEVKYSAHCILPLTSCTFVGRVLSPKEIMPIVARIYLDGSFTYEKRIMGDEFSVNAKMPPTLLASAHLVKLSVGPENRSYDPYVVEVRVLEVNAYGIFLIAGIGVVLALVEASRMSIGISGIGIRRREHKRPLIKRAFEAFRPLQLKFRRSDAAKAYWDFVRGHPKSLRMIRPEETLREYLRSVGSALGNRIPKEFYEATFLVERDLYSNIRADLSRLKELLRRVEDALR